MRYGVWDGSSYDSDRLIFINLPVLKKHGMADSTICWKSLIGFVSIADTNARFTDWDQMHDFFWGYTGGANAGYGLLGQELALVRAPDLNIVDAIWVATDRRRVLSWLGIATIISGLISLVLVRLARNELIGDIAEPTQQAGAEAAWGIVVNQLVAQTWALIILGLLAVLFAWFFGPSSRVSNLRTSFMTARASSQEGREPNAVTDFLQRYGRILEWVVVVLGVIFLLLVPAVRGWIVLITAIVVIGIVVAIEWIAGSPAAAPPNGEGAESDRADEMAGS